ncbi:MAG: SAM-dependent methyltransferase [Clostridia bacterium]|nr:SAM-dependent methyltransferase [Clostridia bacterium]
MLKDKRLNALISLTPNCETAADIGTDHGILGCELLERRICRRVWFSDISLASLAKARRLAQNKGLGERADFFIGDGAKPLPASPDAAIIAGMGGQMICHIIGDSIEKLKSTTLILGANTNLFELRLWLSQNAFKIEDEIAVCENRRYYVLMKAQSGCMNMSEDELHIGPVLIKKRDDESKAYFAHRSNCAKHALEQAFNSNEQIKQSLGKELERWQKLN